MTTLLRNRLSLLCLCLFAASAAYGQNGAPELNITLGEQRVKFAPTRSFQEMRLEVLNSVGEIVFTHLTTEAEFDWNLRAGNSEALAPGLYRYTLSLKFGEDQSRQHTGHFIVEKGQDQIWLTARDGTEVSGTVLNAARSGGRSITGLGSKDDKSVKRDVSGREIGDKLADSANAVKQEKAALLGTANMVAKYDVGGVNLIDSAITEVGGNVGIGITTPTSILEMVRPGVTDVVFKMQNATRAWSVGVSGTGDFWRIRDNTAGFARLAVTGGTGPTGGNVGIGTTAPATPLEVNGLLRSTRNGNAAQYLQLWGGDSASIRLTGQSTVAAEKPLLIQNLSGEATPGDFNTIQFQLGTTAAFDTKMIINKNGKVGIGTTEPVYKLHVEGDGIGVYSNSSNHSGVYGFTEAAGPSTINEDVRAGIIGESSGNYGIGVAGVARNQVSAIGVYGRSYSSTGVGVFARNLSGGYAGYFDGNVFVNGTINKAAVGFKIDHPLDPANKYLYHTSVESPDMKNIYDGNVTTDENGEATVTLPEWFEALNRDFRYQLTVIGAFAQAMVASKIKNNRFTIKTDKPRVEVSWQVTGIRQDAYANAHRMPIEEEKAEKERGYYLRPELFEQPEEKGVEWARNPEQMRQQKERREKQTPAVGRSPILKQPNPLTTEQRQR